MTALVIMTLSFMNWPSGSVQLAMALLVGVDAALEVVDRLEVEGDGADAELAGLGERAGVAAGHPDRRVPEAVGLGQDVVRASAR